MAGDLVPLDLLHEGDAPESGSPVPQENVRPLSSTEQSSFTQKRQAAATEEPAFKALARATIPTAAAVASGGLSLPLQAAVGAGATGLNQLVGLEDPSWKGIAMSGVMPLMLSSVLKLGKTAAKAGAELIAPGALKEAGVEAAAQRVGAAPTSLERATTAPASRAAFNATKQVGMVPTANLQTSVDDAIASITNQSNPSPLALRHLQNLSAKLKANPNLDYNDVVKEMQSLEGKATSAMKGMRKDSNTGMALQDARDRMLDELDNISPAIKQANSIYRKEKSTDAIIKAMRTGNPGTKIRQLFETNKLVSGSFKPDEIKDVYSIADSISDIASNAPAGLGRQILSSVTEPLSQMLTNPTGRQFLRMTLKPGTTKSPAVLSAAAQFWRAYSASGAANDE